LMNFEESINMDSYQNDGGVREVDFQRLSQNVGTNIQKILQNVASMQRMITQIGTPQDNHQLQTQLHQIQHYTGQLAKDSAKHLKDLNVAVRSQRGGATSEQRQRRLQFDSLQDDFTKALNSFQQVQTQAAQKEKEVIKKARNNQGLLAGPGGKSGGGNLINIDDDSTGASSGGQMTGQSKTQMLLEEEANLQELQDREKSIHQLESDIVDMNTIFKDLATMVHEQGEMVDSIEVHVSDAQVRVEEGTQQLRQAEGYKIAARKKKLILAVVGFIVLAILIGIIAWQASD